MSGGHLHGYVYGNLQNLIFLFAGEVRGEYLSLVSCATMWEATNIDDLCCGVP